MSKDTFYFSHDYNARSDPKIKKLLAKWGYEGYGIFWAIIEDLYQNANALPLDMECIAYDMRCDTDTVYSIIHNFDLFVIDGDVFGSTSVQSRLDERAKKSETARNSARKRWGEDANALQTHCQPNAIKERKGKESKEKKKEGVKKNTPPTQDEVINYFQENGYSTDAAIKAFKYYDVAQWHDSKGNKVKSWKQKMQAVWFKEENKQTATTTWKVLTPQDKIR